jgi:hypothetical protein
MQQAAQPAPQAWPLPAVAALLPRQPYQPSALWSRPGQCQREQLLLTRSLCHSALPGPVMNGFIINYIFQSSSGAQEYKDRMDRMVVGGWGAGWHRLTAHFELLCRPAACAPILFLCLLFGLQGLRHACGQPRAPGVPLCICRRCTLPPAGCPVCRRCYKHGMFRRSCAAACWTSWRPSTLRGGWTTTRKCFGSCPPPSAPRSPCCPSATCWRACRPSPTARCCWRTWHRCCAAPWRCRVRATNAAAACRRRPA